MRPSEDFADRLQPRAFSPGSHDAVVPSHRLGEERLAEEECQVPSLLTVRSDVRGPEERPDDSSSGRDGQEPRLPTGDVQREGLLTARSLHSWGWTGWFACVWWQGGGAGGR